VDAPRCVQLCPTRAGGRVCARVARRCARVQARLCACTCGRLCARASCAGVYARAAHLRGGMVRVARASLPAICMLIPPGWRARCPPHQRDCCRQQRAFQRATTAYPPGRPAATPKRRFNTGWHYLSLTRPQGRLTATQSQMEVSGRRRKEREGEVGKRGRRGEEGAGEVGGCRGGASVACGGSRNVWVGQASRLPFTPAPLRMCSAYTSAPATASGSTASISAGYSRGQSVTASRTLSPAGSSTPTPATSHHPA